MASGSMDTITIGDKGPPVWAMDRNALVLSSGKQVEDSNIGTEAYWIFVPGSMNFTRSVSKLLLTPIDFLVAPIDFLLT